MVGAGAGAFALGTGRFARAQSATPAAGIKQSLDISYATRSGSDPNLTRLDVCAPDGARDLPVMVFVHGGGWRRGDKSIYTVNQSNYFCLRGFVYVGVNYRLAPAVTYPGFSEDVAAAIGWIKTSIASYGGDPLNIVISGHSAGSQLVAYAGVDEKMLNAAGVQLSDLKGVIAIDGAAYEIPSGMMRPGSQYTQMIQSVFTSDPTVWQEASATSHIAAGKGIPPYLIFSSHRPGGDTMSTLLADAFKKANVPAEYVLSKDDSHMTIVRNYAVAGTFVASTTAGWLKSQLGLSLD